MKKIISLLTVSFIIIPFTFGQLDNSIKKGNLLTGGSFSFNIEKNRDINPGTLTDPEVVYTNRSRSFETDFNIGYFVCYGFNIGIISKVYISTTETENSLTSNKIDYINNDLFIGPLIRYYTNKGIFLECAAGIGLYHYSLKTDPVKWKNYYWSSGIGYSLFLTESVALEPVIQYKHLIKDAYKIEEGKNIIQNLSLSIGMKVYLKLNKN